MNHYAFLAPLLVATTAWSQHPIRTIEGPYPSDQFGSSVSRLGDVDRDGVPDFVVGASAVTSNKGNRCRIAGTGSATVVSGKTGAQIHRVTGPGICAFGSRVSGLGDVDKDGVPDFAVGDDNSTVRIYSGKTAAMLKQLTTGGGGVALGELGDVDNDGYADVLIGAFYNHEAKVYSGKTFAVIRTFSGTTGEQFGWAVSGVGDLDNDKVPDLAIGAPNNRVPGRVVVYSGRTGAKLKELKGTSATTPDLFGRTVSEAGDLDNDGTPDILIGASGQAFAISGKTFQRLHVFAESGGNVVDSLGDVDGDGHDDYVSGFLYTGSWVALEIVSGKSGKLVRYLSDWEGIGNFNVAAGVGDVNGDGTPDVVVGVPQGAGYKGKVRVFSGALATMAEDKNQLSVSKGGSVTLAINAGSIWRTKLYALTGSWTGTAPGIQLDGSHVLPLVPDTYTNYLLGSPNALIQNNVGFLNSYGKANPRLILPANLVPQLVGVKLHHAFVVIDFNQRLFLHASNAVTLELTR